MQVQANKDFIVRALRSSFGWLVLTLSLIAMPASTQAKSATNPIDQQTIAQQGDTSPPLSSSLPAQTEQNVYLPNITTATDASSQPTPQPTPQPIPPIEPPEGGFLPAEERLQIIQAVEDRVAEILPPIGTPLEERNFIAELELLGKELLQTPGVVATFITTDTLTVDAVMADGLTITIINNRPVEPPPASSSIASNTPNGNSHHNTTLIAGNVTPLSVPGSRRAVVTNFDGGDNVASEVRSLLTEAGYNVLPLTASLSDMKNYKDLGFLYLDTHGASFRQYTLVTDANGNKRIRAGRIFYGVQTSTTINLEHIVNYQNELNSREIVISLGEEESGRTAKFAISEQFISKYWTFDQGFVVLHTCFGGASLFVPGSTCHGEGCFLGNEPGVHDPTVFRTMMLTKGANAVVGFDHLTNTDYARPSIMFMLDRLLGSNTIEKVTGLPLRPFPLDEVRAEMGSRNLLSFFRPKKVLLGVEYGGGNTVNLSFDTKNTATILKPTIYKINVMDDPGKNRGDVEIGGIFGPTMGTVTIDGAPTSIQSWTNNKIVVTTPFRGNGAAGDLVVQSPSPSILNSNPVPITFWRGDLNLTMVKPNQGTLKASATFAVEFRADLHPARLNINSSPNASLQMLYLNSAHSHVSAEGSYTHPEGGLESWGGGGELTVMGKDIVDLYRSDDFASAQLASQDTTQSSGMVGGYVELTPNSNRARLCIVLEAFYDINIQIEGESGTAPGYLSVRTLSPVLDGSRGLLTCVNMTLNNDYSIAADSHIFINEGVHYTLQWSRIVPVAAPNDQTPG